jgi:hypothetical protein
MIWMIANAAARTIMFEERTKIKWDEKWTDVADDGNCMLTAFWLGLTTLIKHVRTHSRSVRLYRYPLYIYVGIQLPINGIWSVAECTCDIYVQYPTLRVDDDKSLPSDPEAFRQDLFRKLRSDHLYRQSMKVGTL